MITDFFFLPAIEAYNLECMRFQEEQVLLEETFVGRLIPRHGHQDHAI